MIFKTTWTDPPPIMSGVTRVLTQWHLNTEKSRGQMHFWKLTLNFSSSNVALKDFQNEESGKIYMQVLASKPTNQFSTAIRFRQDILYQSVFNVAMCDSWLVDEQGK